VVEEQSSDEEPEVAPLVKEQPSDTEPEVAFTVPKEPSYEEPEVELMVQEQQPIHEERVSIHEWSPKISAEADQPAGSCVLEFENEGLIPVVVQHTEPDQIPLIQQELEENKDYPREEFEDVELYTGRTVNEWEIDYEFVTAVNRIMTP
jgi:hypothetical protein